MIDQGFLDRLKPACARIMLKDDRTLCGTGYLVAPRLVATCHHVVDRFLDEALRCRFGDATIADRGAKALRWDSVRDVALLELETPLIAEAVLLESHASRPEEWYAYGFPAFAGFLGIPIDGRILDANTVDKDGRPALSLFVNSFAAALPESVGGFSGSPVLSGRRLVGQLFRVLGAEDGWQRPRLGICYATPAWAVAALVAARGAGDVTAQISPLPGAGPPAGQSSAAETAARLRRYESGAEAIEAMRIAGNPGEVLKSLRRWEEADLPRQEGLFLAAEMLVGMADAEGALTLLAPVADTARARQLRALALSVKGDHATARALLLQLPASEETAGINGGILKRRWLRERRKPWLIASYESYRCRNEVEPTAYLAVNVAALALQLGDVNESRREAERTRRLVLAMPEGDRTHWDWASLAEAELLLGDFGVARRYYGRAVAGAAGNVRDVAVMRRQARLDLDKLGYPPGALDAALPVGGVACVVSALLDESAWTDVRIGAVRARIAGLLRDHQVLFGFGSAARGGDLLFAEALLDVGAAPTVFLPVIPEAFERNWVGAHWRGHFERIPSERRSVVAPRSPDRPFSGCDEEALRAAADFGRRLDERPLLLVIQPLAGTADVRVADAVARWNAWSWSPDLPGQMFEIPLA